MYLFDFNSKLRRLNPLLYIQQDAGAKQGAGLHSHSIRIRKAKRESLGDSNQVTGDTARYMRNMSEGHVDEFICGVTSPWVPEHEQWNADNGKLVARGWRGILVNLVRRKITTLDKARRVFNCPSLLESDYDRMDFEMKQKQFLSEVGKQ